MNNVPGLMQAMRIPQEGHPEVRGWLTPAEGTTLTELARDKLVLEIGSYCGKSTICMARSARKVHAVDWCQGDWSSGYEWLLPELSENLRRHGVLGKVILHVGTARDICPLFAKGIFDLVFVDGSHDKTSVMDDLRIVKPLLKMDGILAVHDWYYPAIRQAVKEVFGWDGEATIDTLYCKRCEW